MYSESRANFGMNGAISLSQINRKVHGENGSANVPKVEAMDVIRKKAGNTLYYYVFLITLSSAIILCVQLAQFSQISS